MTNSARRKHLIFLSPRAADPVVQTLAARLNNGPPAGGDWGPVTTTIVPTRAPLSLCCRPEAMGTSTLAGVPIDEVTGVYVGALPPRVPGLKPGAPDEADTRLRDQQRADGDRDALCALLAHVDAAGRTVLNTPVGGTLLQNKLEHLALAAGAGLVVPPTVYGDEQAAKALADAGPAVDKPARAWTATEVADGALRRGLMRQRRVDGSPVRVLVLDGAVLGAARVEGTSAVDHRRDPAFVSGEARYEPVTLPDDVLTPLRSLLGRVGYRFAGVDFLVGDDGWCFLEANAAPIWVEQAERTGVDVAGALLATLLTDLSDQGSG